MFHLRMLALASFALHVTASAAVLTIAHRGNSMFAPENTLAAFAAARGKADLIEFDVYSTADEQLIVIHDGTVNRTTDGTGAVGTNFLANLRLLDAGSWFAPEFAGERLPTLEETLAAILPEATPLIEHKTGTPDQYLAVLRRMNIVTNVVLHSFDWDFLRQIHALEPNLRLAALGGGYVPTSDTISAIKATGARTVHWNGNTLSSGVVAMVHSAGCSLWAWTIDGPLIPRFLDMGVDGITTDDPAMLRSYLQPDAGSSSLADRLRAYWRFDDAMLSTAPITLTDSVGTNAGTFVIGSPRAADSGPVPTPKFGYCVKVAGTNAAVDFPVSPDLDINTNAVTISGWVMLRDLPSAISEPYAGVFDSAEDSYVLYLDNANRQFRFKLTTVTGEAARPGIPESLLQTNQWLHICATFNGAAGRCAGQAAIYLNGVMCDVRTASDFGGTRGLTGNVKPGQAAAIGRNGPNGPGQFFGAVDDFAVWSRALTPLEVRRIYQAGQQGASLHDLLRTPSNLVRLLSLSRGALPGQWQITFQSLGPWKTYTLLRSSSAEGPYLPVPGLNPILIDTNATCRFDYPSDGQSSGFFRVAGD